MSKYSAIHDDTNEIGEIVWRKFPAGHPYREYGWYRLFWGEKELAWLTRSRSLHWDVLFRISVPDSKNARFRGMGFATRWYATEYVLKCVGIWKPDH